MLNCSYLYFVAVIDECALGRDDCDQICINVLEGYTCDCDPGYVLEPDGHTCKCGGTLTALTGSFQTPGWPNSYPRHNLQCEWIITVPGTPSISIEFTIDDSAFGINGRPPCTRDHIEFFDGTSTNAASLEKICGLADFYESNTLPIITTTSSSARVVFTGSDRPRSSSRVGVKVDYTAGGKYMFIHTVLLYVSYNIISF